MGNWLQPEAEPLNDNILNDYICLTYIPCVSPSPWCSVPWSTETRRSRQSSPSTWRTWPHAATRPSASLTLRRSLLFSLFLFSSLCWFNEQAGTDQWSVVSYSMARWSHVTVESKQQHIPVERFFFFFLILTAGRGWTSSPALTTPSLRSRGYSCISTDVVHVFLDTFLRCVYD